MNATELRHDYLERKAAQACRLLAEAYHAGLEAGGTVDRSDVDRAFEVASEVVAEADQGKAAK